jgi:hypothetical protein
MTTTIFRPRFIADAPDSHVRCMGANHHDDGQRGTCVTCLRHVVRVVRADGSKRLYNINSRYTVNDNRREDYACWDTPHTCDQEFAARVQAERDVQIAEGRIVLGQHVRVTRGRKVAKGTEGTIFWLNDATDFNGNPIIKVGIKTEAGDSHFLPSHYVVATNAIPAAETAPDAPKTTVEGDTPTRRSSGSHATCEHAATKAARAACRKARQG